jgi:acylpyruvate hydrolase
MKIVVYGPDQRVGALQGSEIIDLNGAYAKHIAEAKGEPLPYAMASAMTPANLQDFIAAGERALDSSQAALEYLSTKAQDKRGLRGESLTFAAGEVRLHPPLVSRAAKIMNCGGNYADHSLNARLHRQRQDPRLDAAALEQTRQESRERGMWGFHKIAQCVIGDEEEIVYPSHSQRLDYEGEIAVVFGKPVKDVKADRLLDYVWGYTIHVDYSLRDQREPQGSTFFFGKNFDGGSAVGPCIVVGEISDPQAIPFETRVNGEQRQSGSTKDMIFSFAEWTEYLSSRYTLAVGDMISGGTCAGTAMDASEYDESGVSDPRLFLKPGDLVEISSPLIGIIRNRIVTGAG